MTSFQSILLALALAVPATATHAADDPKLNQALQDHIAYVATFAMPGAGDPAKEGYELSALTGDCDGDGVPDVLIVTPGTVYVYRNENGKRPEGPAVPGTGMNVTLY